MELTITETVRTTYVIDDKDTELLLRAGLIRNPEYLEEASADDITAGLERAGVEPREVAVEERQLTAIVIAEPAPIYAVMNIPCTVVHATTTTRDEAETISAGLPHSFVHTLSPQESVNVESAAQSVVPDEFWGQIDHQLQRIAHAKPETFAGVREILLDPVYDQIWREINRNGETTFGDHAAFFSGGGGDKTLAGALKHAGWNLIDFRASYHYVVQNVRTGEMLTYTEGDIHAGDQIIR